MPDPDPNDIKEYHVFLASPGDVDDERKAVRKFFDGFNRTIAKLQWRVQFTVIDWENYGLAGIGEPQKLITEDTLERFKDSLALVIGMMWQRFGSKTSTNESGTQEEFEWALDANQTNGFPEIKWFFKDVKEFKAPPNLADIDEAKKQYEKVLAFRKRVEELGPSQLFYKTFADLDSFRDLLDNDLGMWLADPKRPWSNHSPTAATPPPPVTPQSAGTAHSFHQLPAPPADFTGRVAELDALTGAIGDSRGGAAISGIGGMGGVGKTALALMLARQLSDDYPDAQFYLDLKGAHEDMQPVTTAEAMAHVVRAYYPDQRLPDDEASLAGLYQSVLHGRRAIVLMDNAAGREQVEPLIPPDGCLLLVTSRTRFTLPGLYACDLDALPADDARELLVVIAERIKGSAEVDEIVKLCGRLPLAIRLAGSALAEHRDLSPADYVARLGEAGGRLELIEPALSLSFDLLGEELRDQWSMLAVFPDTFDTPAAAAVWGLEAGPGQETISELVRLSLVDWEAETSRYRLHDLARVFAADRLTNDNRAAAECRHAEHYMAVLGTSNQLYMEGGDAIQRGLELFDLEWPTSKPARPGPTHTAPTMRPPHGCATSIPTRASTASTSASTRANGSAGSNRPWPPPGS